MKDNKIQNSKIIRFNSSNHNFNTFGEYDENSN